MSCNIKYDIPTYSHACSSNSVYLPEPNPACSVVLSIQVHVWIAECCSLRDTCSFTGGCVRIVSTSKAFTRIIIQPYEWSG